MSRKAVLDSTHIVHISRRLLLRRLRRFVTKRDGVDAARRCGIEPVGLREDYEKRLSYYMSKTDFGPEDVKYSSYLNVYTGLVAYEILRDAGFTEEEAFAAYNYMSAPMRKVAHAMHRVIDVVPGGFSFIRRTIISDLTGSKRLCWSTKLIRNDNEVFEYKITRCLYYEVCKAHGCPELTRAFCEHDDFAYGAVRKHVKFTRFESFGDGGTCCHDRFEKI